MKHVSVAARPRSARLPLPASRWGRLLASALIAGIAAVAAAPAVASQASARSITSARSVTSSPLPRAFFGLGPASKTKIDGRPFFSWSANKGSHLTDHVAIVNFGATPVTLRVFVSNAVTTSNGATGFLPPGKSIGGPAGWVTIQFPHNSSVVHLAPRTKVILKITVNIPKNASPGDHVGAVIAALTSVIRSKNHARVHLVQQVADRIITRISGKLVPGLSVTGLHVAYSDPVNPFTTAPAHVTFMVKNTGNALLGGKATISVQGVLGSTATAKHVVIVPILLPGGSDHFSATVDGVYPEFWMTAKVTIEPLVVSGQADTGLTNYTGQAGFLAVPWIPFGIVILLVAGVIARWLRRRRRRGAASISSPASARGRELVEN